MSSTSTEQAIVSAKANVMIYDDLTKKWNPAGVTSGLSKVYIYQNLLNQTYRVVGRKVQDHECVINCMLSKAVKHQANQTFLQWRDVKQVYGLHFQSKEETDLFTQVLKTAVENLARIAAPNSGSNGDNISLGKRSISSEYNNPLIYDENDRQQMYNSNGHHPNGGNYTVNNRMQQTQQQQQQQHVTSPPLSNSSSSSSSTISSSGLSVNTVNGGQNGHMQQQLTNGQHHQTNGHMQQQINNAYQINNQRQNGLVDYNNYAAQQQQHQLHQTPVYNLQQQINTSSTSSSSSSSSVGVGGGGPSNPLNQHPLYQSSPIPPPPPPPSVPAFSNQNNSHDNNHPQKIYDVIPDNSNYTPSHQTNSTTSVPPPPPPPMPVGLFGTANGGPPPPPPISSMQSLNLNSNNNNSRQQNATSHADELSRSIANRQLKKVDESSSSSSTTSSSSSSGRGGPPQLDFLTEIRQKLEAKNLGINGGSSNDNENLKPSNGLKKISRTALNTESPKPIKKNSSSPNVIPSSSNLTNGANNNNNISSNNNNNSVNNHGLDNQSYDRLKQELMSEFRKELQMIKSDIVNSILQELRR